MEGGGVRVRSSTAVGGNVLVPNHVSRPVYCKEFDRTGFCSRGDRCWNAAGHKK